jgi:DNA-binding response OmpR family regulator
MNILIVEDDDRIADFLIRGLRAEGYRVQRAADGPTGLAMAQDAARLAQADGGPTLLLLDLMLPGLSGLEICQTLRAEQVGLPILMLTAQGALEDRVAGLRLGADDYLCKPFEFEELLARLEALARRGRDQRPRPANRLQVGDLALDRERILANVWGSSEDPLTNVVDVYIRRLRGRIDTDGQPALIHTVRGLGYRLEAAPED